jgi:hypothetical protein
MSSNQSIPKKLLDQRFGLSGKMLGIVYKLRTVDFVVLSIRFDADKGYTRYEMTLVKSRIDITTIAYFDSIIE